MNRPQRVWHLGLWLFLLAGMATVFALALAARERILAAMGAG